MTQHTIVATDDGSFTVFSAEVGEHYHSTKGAFQESQYIFIKEGIMFYLSNNYSKNKINILEIGFGTGLNALLALKASNDLNLEIHYISIEKYPLSVDLAQKLNYGNMFDDRNYSNYFQQLHQASWGTEIKICNFHLYKTQIDIANYLPHTPIDIVFFDAFSPNVQPELWTVAMFTKINVAMTKNGILTTYSSKGDVRRNLITSGFSVEKLQGPPGKRHILRATKHK